jgi:uncharacterized integral membrane protein
MTEEPHPSSAPPDRFGGLSNRAIIAIVVGVLVLLFIVLNRRETNISFIVFSAKTPLWAALTLAALGGFAAGYLMSRRHHKD